MNVRNNLLTRLPPLPQSLLVLCCTGNGLIQFPQFPPNLKLLEVDLIDTNVSLPNSLEVFSLKLAGDISTVPEIPETIEKVWITDF